MNGLFKAKPSSQNLGKTLYFELEQGATPGARGGTVFGMKITALNSDCPSGSNGLGPRGTRLVRKVAAPERFLSSMPQGKIGYFGCSIKGEQMSVDNSVDMYVQDVHNLRAYLT